jgi:hypothetical protein
LEVRDDLVVGGDDDFTAAGGGIVAFQAGGAAFAPSLITGVGYEPEQESSAFGRAITGFFTRSDDLEALRKRAMVKQAQGLPLTATEVKVLQDQTSPAPATPTGGIAGDNRAALNRVDAGIRSLPALTDAEKAAQAAVTTKPLAPSAAPGAAPRDTGSGAAPSMPSGGLADIFKDIDAQKKELMGRAKEAEGIELAGLEKDRTALEAAKEEAKKYGTEQAEKYKKRGERLEKDEKQNPYMSLIEAGLAIAAGESPNALKNLAVGAQQGLKGYQARLEKVNEGRDNLDEAMFKLYNIRNDKVTAAGDKLRELNRAETKVKADAVRSLSEISKGMFGEEIKLKTKQIDQMFEMSKTRFEQGQATERAKLTADRGDPVLRRAAYQGLQEELERNQRLLMGYSNNPEKAEAARQEIRRIKGEMDALLPSGGGKVAGSSTLPSGFKLD